jgi:transcriptional regulator with XRE-family HTH domain
MDKNSYVKEWMEFRGLNANSLAQISGVGKNTIYRLFKSIDKKRGRYAPRKAIADALGVTIEQLRKPPSDEPIKKPIIEKEFLLSDDERDIKMRIMELVCFDFTKEELKQILGYLEGMKSHLQKKAGT